MQTRTDEIAPDVFRFSTCLPVTPDGFTFNQFLVRADEPLLFHTGPRRLFPLVSEAVAKVMPLARLRWITFGHYESDECGAMNEWLAVAPHSQVAHGMTAVMVSLEDMASRAPRTLADGETIDLGGKRVRYIDTPHVPHGWEAGVLFEETAQTPFGGDLFSHPGGGPPIPSNDTIGPARAAEEGFHASCYTPTTGATIRRLAALAPKTLAVMHGSSYRGDGAKALRDLADLYDDLHRKAAS